MEATATPTATGPTTGPTSFSDTSLTWSGDSSTPTPTPTPDAAITPADATAPPATETVGDGTTPPGEPPRERWDAILANARQKAAEEALAPVAWAKDVSPQDFQQLQQIAKHFSGGDLVAGLQSLIAEIRKDPQHDAALKSLHARALQQARQQTTAPAQTPDLNPIPIQLEDGRTLSMFSADQMQAYLAQEVAKVRQEFQPVVQTHEQLQAERAAAKQQAAQDQFVSTQSADIKTWPGMEDPANLKAFTDELAQMPIRSDDPRDVILAAYRAHHKVVAPRLRASGESALLDTLKTKAAAASSVNPGGAATSTPRKVTSFNDPSLTWK